MTPAPKPAQMPEEIWIYPETANSLVVVEHPIGATRYVRAGTPAPAIEALQADIDTVRDGIRHSAYADDAMDALDRIRSRIRQTGRDEVMAMIIPNQLITFEYTNYRGERSTRTAKTAKVHYGTTAYHPDPCWLLTGYDFDKQENRTYAMKDMVNVRHYDPDEDEIKEAALDAQSRGSGG